MRSRQIRSGLSAWLTIVGVLAFSSANVEAAPVISSLSPNSATAGGSGFTLTVNGTDFGGLLVTAIVQWNGNAKATTFVSNTQLTAVILASDIAAAGTAQITVLNDGVLLDETSLPVSFTINSPSNPVPVISSLSPTSVVEDGPNFTLTVNGSNFIADSRVRLDNSNQNTTFISATQLTARIQDNDIRQPGTLSITVVNPTPGGGTSNAMTLTVTSSLTITTSSPLPAAVAGSPYSQTLTAAGGTTPYSWSIVGGLIPGGLSLASSTGALSGTPSATGTFGFDVRVSDSGQPSPQTATKTFTLVVSGPPSPQLSALTPNSVNAGGPAFTMVISGANFVSGSTVRWNGANRTTTFTNSAQLIAAIPASDITIPGTASVTVVNPGSITSNALIFTISGPSLTITTNSPLPPGTVGTSYSQTLGASGGTPPYTWSVSSGSLPAGLALGASNGTISGTPSAGGSSTFTVRVSDTAAVSVTKQFQLSIADASGPVLSSINPSSVTAGGPAFTLTVNGPNFLSSSTVRWNGSNRTTTFVNSSQLTAAIPAADIAAPGTASLTVMNPGGATSNALTLTITSPGSLTITTGSPLPQGTIGISYSQTLAASGGTAPYTWSLSAGSLPAGLTLNASVGTVGGTPSALGTTTFTVRVLDSVSASATKQFQLVIGSTATPSFTISGVSDSVEPAQQPSVEITLTSAHPSPISGQLALKFTSNADVASDDPSIQFSTGGRTVNFSIPANTTRAVFSNGSPNIAFQTGTVSGTIELSVSGQSGGSSPLPPASRTATLSRRAPAVTRLIIASRTASGFELAITGFSTPRSLTQATFLFTAAQGANLQTSTLTSTLGTAATSWFQSPTGTSLGGQFRLSMPFTVQGEVTAIQSVSVTLTNGAGTSTASSVQF